MHQTILVPAPGARSSPQRRPVVRHTGPMPILFTQEVWSTGQAAESIAGVDGSPSKDGPQTHECCHDRRVIDLPGVERLQRDFNQYPRAVRVFAVLSPTCPDCLVGYELVSHMAPTTVRLLLWTAMRDGDSASVVSTLIGDDRDCNHYWEDDGWPVSTRLRPLLGFCLLYTSRCV